MSQLKAGRAGAAGGNAEVVHDFAEREHVAYRVLWSSEPFLNLALSAHPSVPRKKVNAVREAFLQMADDPEGLKALEASAAVLKESSLLRFIPAKDADFDDIRRFYRTTPLKVELH